VAPQKKTCSPYGRFIQLLNHPIPFSFVEVMPFQSKGDLPLEKTFTTYLIPKNFHLTNNQKIPYIWSKSFCSPKNYTLYANLIARGINVQFPSMVKNNVWI